MDRRILVAYASEFGTTCRVAEAIGAALCDADTVIDVRPVVQVDDVAPYQAVVVGSAIYNGRWLPEAVHFVRYHEAALSQVPVTYFAVSMTMRSDTAKNRRTVLDYLQLVRTAAPSVKPVDIGLFAGKMDYGNLPHPSACLPRDRRPPGYPLHRLRHAGSISRLPNSPP